MEDLLKPSTSITRLEPLDARVITTMLLTLETLGYTLMESTHTGTNSSDSMETTSTINRVKYLMLILRMKKELMLLL